MKNANKLYKQLIQVDKTIDEVSSVLWNYRNKNTTRDKKSAIPQEIEQVRELVNVIYMMRHEMTEKTIELLQYLHEFEWRWDKM